MKPPICGYCKKNIIRHPFIGSGAVLNYKKLKTPFHERCFAKVLKKAYEK